MYTVHHMSNDYPPLYTYRCKPWLLERCCMPHVHSYVLYSLKGAKKQLGGVMPSIMGEVSEAAMSQNRHVRRLVRHPTRAWSVTSSTWYFLPAVAAMPLTFLPLQRIPLCMWLQRRMTQDGKVPKWAQSNMNASCTLRKDAYGYVGLARAVLGVVAIVVRRREGGDGLER
ncbi:uncharacterized protein EV422DRAFT_317870 [Fimicolochytrium jonesii]|uniref:uncharacterized protein n=1 Tax=Fimicolochytrium jonesii TaxID=1396493 RepID=UPI0022FDEC0A|nr:uncharacterized protein EV422DRAFT_317870 [Fimicolochytrium jonesii]KAI8824356.1 hypothetical protein EV422DRAFT_317870 [Fimicolochytrium jonesii]